MFKTVKGGLGMLPQKIFKIKMLRLAENEFHTTKFPDLSFLFLKNSLTFSPCIEILRHFQVFQVAGHPVCCMKFIFSQLEDLNFETFLGEHAPTLSENDIGFTIEFNPSLEKSGVASLLESENSAAGLSGLCWGCQGCRESGDWRLTNQSSQIQSV